MYSYIQSGIVSCNLGDIRELESVVEGMKISSYDEIGCKICTQDKMTQLRSRIPDRRAKAPLELVHSDLAGPVNPVGKYGFNCWPYLLLMITLV